MNIRPIRLALLSFATLPLPSAFAAPQILPLGEADKHGAIVYSVKCDDGSKKILQCVRDDQHCGYAGDTPLSALVEDTCKGGSAKTAPPAPAADSPPFETSPSSSY